MDASDQIAHIDESGRTHSLHDHLNETAKLAASMASAFGSSEWGYLVGLWHDLGKFNPEFQDRLKAIYSDGEDGKKKRVGIDHSTAGALLSEKQFSEIGRVLAYAIAGHHGGLPDWQSDYAGQGSLAHRLSKSELLEAALKSNAANKLTDQPIPQQKPSTGSDPALWIRMLFSCLVDADYLNTENFFSPDKTTARGNYPTLSELLTRFNSYVETFTKGSDQTPINLLRNDIFAACVSTAKESPGLFNLDVPTGGGKTISSMGFALNHAEKHGHQRVIYVIPYTSIIEQTADQFRNIFGEAVVEHHSNIIVADGEEQYRNRLASENWDAPIIVTTAVQFFESLFAARTSRCRKLHNIAKSVVIFDEVQLLPPDFLNPILHVLDDLVKNYGVSQVLCTATQPAFTPQSGPDFNFKGLSDIRAIIPNPEELHRAFKRVKVNIPNDLQTPVPWESLAEDLTQHPSVLCIVNRRDDCRDLHARMPQDTIHLSALMCGSHRSEVIAEIKNRLTMGQPTRVISTQLVEAGVDLDFPVVYRALAGLDSIAQAAGRCNREGNLDCGDVFVFIPPSKPPRGDLRKAVGISQRLLAQKPVDPFEPSQFERYFRELFWLKGSDLDRHGILEDLTVKQGLAIKFRTAASKFKIIDESLHLPVLVSYGQGQELIQQLEKHGPERWLLRRLQRFVVNIPRSLHGELLRSGAIEEIFEGVFAQKSQDLYDPDLGVNK